MYQYHSKQKLGYGNDVQSVHFSFDYPTTECSKCAIGVCAAIASCHNGDSSRNRAICVLSSCTAASTCSAVVKRPRLRRRELKAKESERPNARMTCEGSITAEEHAEPLETAMFCNANNSASPCT